ncbi:MULTISPECIES: hypothetical protein [Hyphobacterium]|uniref:Uncharacterized protein n=1 Tax=Hyphobacterium vulgare TaxID=1736751 RepID=A0ABV7A0I4_9PROT
MLTYRERTLKISEQTQNELKSLVEIECAAVQGSDESRLALNLVVRCGEHEIFSDRYQAVCGVSECRVKITYENLEIAKNTRLQDGQAPHQIDYLSEISKTEFAGTQTHVEARALASASKGIGAEGRAKWESKSFRKNRTNESVSGIKYRVRALSADLWSLAEVTGGVLEGRIIGDDNICDLAKTDDKLGEIYVDLFVRPDWIVLKELYKIDDGSSVRITNGNKAKIIEILIKKAIGRIGANITLSQSRLIEVVENDEI